MSNRNTSLDNAKKITSLTDKAKKRGFDDKYYIESDRAENSAYKDYYLQSKIIERRQTNTREEEATEQIFVLLKNGKIDEFSNCSDIINTLRNKKFVLERLYFPEELRNDVKSLQLE
jgi:HD superfamily phosphohydrolase